MDPISDKIDEYPVESTPVASEIVASTPVEPADSPVVLATSAFKPGMSQTPVMAEPVEEPNEVKHSRKRVNKSLTGLLSPNLRKVGWKAAISEKNPGRVYYYNEDREISQWERPSKEISCGPFGCSVARRPRRRPRRRGGYKQGRKRKNKTQRRKTKRQMTKRQMTKRQMKKRQTKRQMKKRQTKRQMTKRRTSR